MKLRRTLVLAALCLTLVLNGVAYVAHHHNVESGGAPATHAELCGWCSAFGGLATAPTTADTLSLTFVFIVLALLSIAAPLQRRHWIGAQPRAPPIR